MLMVASCAGGEEEQTNESEIINDSIAQPIPDPNDSIATQGNNDIPRPSVRFICRDIGENMDNPLFEVSLLVDNAYYTLDTIHTCNSIKYEDYEEFEIPNSSLTAAGGWWKDEGDYFFAVEQYGEIVVMHAWQTEEQSTQGYFYKEKRRILLPKPIPLEDI